MMVCRYITFLNAFDSVKQGDNNKICTMLNQTLFQYTNSRLDGNNYDHKNESNGAFSGDSSLMYLYSCYMQLQKDRFFWSMLKKQYMMVKENIEYDKNYDLLYGNAGVVLILLNMFKLTGDKKYLYSYRNGNNIINNSIKMETGLGWIPRNLATSSFGWIFLIQG